MKPILLMPVAPALAGGRSEPKGRPARLFAFSLFFRSGLVRTGLAKGERTENERTLSQKPSCQGSRFTPGGTAHAQVKNGRQSNELAQSEKGHQGGEQGRASLQSSIINGPCLRRRRSGRRRRRGDLPEVTCSEGSRPAPGRGPRPGRLPACPALPARGLPDPLRCPWGSRRD